MSARLRLVGQVAAIGLVASLLALLIWKVASDDQSNVATEFSQGKRPAPKDFTLQRLNGEGDLKLSSLRGKVVVVNFWASWCEPCKTEAPLFQAASERYGDRVEFVGVDTTDYSGDARQFLDRYGVKYQNVRDRNGRVLADYGGLPIPRTFVIGRSWKVSGYIFGETRAEELHSAIQEALGA
jgi:cytochrome c biogenesis protein CcmG, thiol:disulfide interchange protein DsbE